MFEDASFDVVLQIDTLQHLRNAETMLTETARVGRLGHRGLPQFCPLAQPPEYLAGPHASHPSPALPVVRHAQYPRRHPCRLGRDWHSAMACGCWTALVCSKGASCAGCPTCGRVPRSTSWRANAQPASKLKFSPCPASLPI